MKAAVEYLLSTINKTICTQCDGEGYSKVMITIEEAQKRGLLIENLDHYRFFGISEIEGGELCQKCNGKGVLFKGDKEQGNLK